MVRCDDLALGSGSQVNSGDTMEGGGGGEEDRCSGEED
jgi:hypothetical protein